MPAGEDQPTPWGPLLTAEFLGTFFLVFAGCGAMLSNDITAGVVGHTTVGIVWGLVVMALIYAIGDISGCHINPAVTIAFWVAGRFPRRKVLPYLVTQFAGATAAALALRLLFPVLEGTDLGATIPSPDTSVVQLFILELLLTFLLMLVILGVSTGAKEKGITAAIAIGGTVGLEALFCGPITRASMNPARSLGPAVVSGDTLALSTLWVYLVATTLGAILAVVVYRYMRSGSADTEG
ncbi:MAG: MIP family channel protein [Planctomycetota bacterium]